MRRFEDRAGEIARQRGDGLRIADLDEAGRDRHIGRGHCAAAEDQRFSGQPIADTLRSDGERVWFDKAAAAERDRQQIRHAEERAHAAHLDDRIGFARKTAAQLADIGRRAAHIDDHRVAEPRQKGSTAHRVGGTRGEAHDRQRGRGFGRHHRSIILGQIKRGGDAARRDCLR